VLRKHQYWFAFGDPRWDALAGCPAFFYETRDGYFYGFPAIDGRVKVARHTGGEPVPDPSTVDRSMDPQDLEKIRAFARRHLNQRVDQPVEHAVCMYTMSPDEHFILDRHPAISQVVYCAGLSGHGFKFAPVLGRYLVELVQGGADPQFAFLSAARLGQPHA
jgi:glycine/D-amino acid oxidase-like deaminating enzyme